MLVNVQSSDQTQNGRQPSKALIMLYDLEFNKKFSSYIGLQWNDKLNCFDVQFTPTVCISYSREQMTEMFNYANSVNFVM